MFDVEMAIVNIIILILLNSYIKNFFYCFILILAIYSCKYGCWWLKWRIRIHNDVLSLSVTATNVPGKGDQRTHYLTQDFTNDTKISH